MTFQFEVALALLTRTLVHAYRVSIHQVKTGSQLKVSLKKIQRNREKEGETVIKQILDRERKNK